MSKPVNTLTDGIRLFLFNRWLSHALMAHILQRELYSMDNTSLLRCYAKMTLLQPHLGETRCQELRNLPFWHLSLFKSQLLKEGEDFLLKKTPLKTLRVFNPIKISPFVVPITKKEAATRNTPMENSSQSSNQSFSLGRRKANFRGSRGCF